MAIGQNLRLPVFFVLAYAISWLIWLPLILGASGLEIVHVHIEMYPWIPLGTVGPLAAAIITRRVFRGDFRAFRMWAPWRRLILGTIVGTVLVLFTRWILSAIFLTQSGYAQWNWPALGQIRYWALPVLIAGPLGEEPGWRGFALPGLQERFGPAVSSLLLGILWAFWHLPLVLVHGWTTAPFWIFALIITGLSVLMSFGFNLSGGSVITAIIMHDAFNAGGGPLNAFLGKALLRQRPSNDLLVALAFLSMAATLLALTRGNLGRDAKQR